VFNRQLHKVVKTADNAKIIQADLSRNDFTHHGLHLNISGKEKMFNFTSSDVFHNYHKIYIFVQHIYNFLQSIHRLHVSALLDHHQALYMNRFLILVHFGIPNCHKDVIKILCAT